MMLLKSTFVFFYLVKLCLITIKANEISIEEEEKDFIQHVSSINFKRKINIFKHIELNFLSNKQLRSRSHIANEHWRIL